MYRHSKRLSAGAILMCLPGCLALAAAAPILEHPAEPLPTPPAASQTAEDRLSLPVRPRGEMLYENHCTGCHESVLFIRERREVKSLPALREEVARWAGEAKAPWREEEIAEVTRHLNRTYYHFPEP